MPKVVVQPNGTVPDKSITEKYSRLPMEQVMVEYVWIDDGGELMKTRTRVFDFEPKSPQDLPAIEVPHSLTPSEDIVVGLINPIAIFRDPFRLGRNKIALCETTLTDGSPSAFNRRRKCVEAAAKSEDQEPWFGFEQEFYLLDRTGQPYGWQTAQNCGPSHRTQTTYAEFYCGVGTDCAQGRDIVESHARACLYAGLSFFGINCESKPCQWEFQMGPAAPLKVSDDLWMARYLLHRVAADYGAIVTFQPKFFSDSMWGASGCHANFSTKRMRAPGGIKEINAAIQRLAPVHLNHMAYYDPNGGKDNEKRLTGIMPVSRIDVFTSGFDRSPSVRLSTNVVKNQCGYLEDRRPSSNCDPYSVTTAMLRTICLEGRDRKLSKCYVPKGQTSTQEISASEVVQTDLSDQTHLTPSTEDLSDGTSSSLSDTESESTDSALGVDFILDAVESKLNISDNEAAVAAN